MMEKSAQPGEGGGCTPTPFHHVQICGVRPGWEGIYVQYTPPISTLPLYVLCGWDIYGTVCTSSYG